MNRSSVAVVIPVGSFGDNLEQQVRAVLDQKCCRPFEIVHSVNNQDPTMAHAVDTLVGSIGNQRLHIVDSSDVRGAAHARNQGVHACNASAVAFCDADDRVHDGWLDALVEGLEKFDAVSGYVVDVFPDERSASWHPPATPGSLPRRRLAVFETEWPTSTTSHCWRHAAPRRARLGTTERLCDDRRRRPSPQPAGLVDAG